MIVRFFYPTPKDVVWTEDACVSLIGQKFDARIKDKKIGGGKILDCYPEEDGFLYFEVEWPDDPETIKLLQELGWRRDCDE